MAEIFDQRLFYTDDAAAKVRRWDERLNGNEPKRIEDICFIIYARLASERVPRKMIRPFANTTLIDNALSKVLKCHTIPKEQFYLCVHEPELIRIGEKRGVNVFKRSTASATEDSHLPTLMEWWDRLPYTYCVAISPCHPFLSSDTMSDCIEIFRWCDHDGLYTIVERNNYFWNAKGEMITEWPEGQDLLNTKAVGKTYEGANAMWAGRLDTIGDGVWMGDFKRDPALFAMANPRECLDVDDDWQFQLCEALYMLRETGARGTVPCPSVGDLAIAPPDRKLRQYGWTFGDLDV